MKVNISRTRIANMVGSVGSGRWLRALVALLAGALSGSAGCSGGGAAAPKTRPPPLVVVDSVVVRDVPVEVRAPIDLRPLFTADVASKQLGYLAAVLVERGDPVRRGQLLAVVRPSDLPDQLQAAQGALSQAQAALLLARTSRERVGALAPAGVVSAQELSQSTAQLAQAEASEAALKAQLGALATRLGETRITAPLDGVIAQRRLDPGALVGPTAGPLLQIAKIDSLRAIVSVREREVQPITVGLPASVEVDALPGRRFPGKVTRLSPGFDPATRTLDVEVQLPNPDGVLRPGMYGHAAIEVAVHKNAKVIPEVALLLVDEQRYVYLVEGDRAKRRKIEVGTDGGTWLEVTSGLAGGETLVTAGLDAIADGVPVRTVRGVNPYTGEQKAGSKAPAANPPRGPDATK